MQALLVCLSITSDLFNLFTEGNRCEVLHADIPFNLIQNASFSILLPPTIFMYVNVAIAIGFFFWSDDKLEGWWGSVLRFMVFF